MVVFDVLDISNSTLNITRNTYSLQDALSPNGDDSTQAINGYIAPYLFHTGCQYHDGGPNCTAACQDPESAFSTLETLHNCMMYPTIADQYDKNNLSSDIAQLAHSLGIEKGQWPSTVSLNITQTIGSCLDAYCNSLENCNSEIQYYNESYYGVSESTFKNFTGSFYFNLDPGRSGTEFDLCAYLPASVNQDIGGIGVRDILNVELSFADCRVGICILLDPNRNQSFGVLVDHLVEMGDILFESQCLCPGAKSQ